MATNSSKLAAKLTAECLGTFALVLAGTGAIATDSVTSAVTHVGVSLTFGLAVLTLIAAVGDVSGAHLNPAVSLGFVLARQLSWKIAALYAAVQSLGAIAASLCVRALWPIGAALGVTQPTHITPGACFGIEALMTGGLMLVILGVTCGAKEKGLTAGLSIGATIALEALFAGPITGASMNPARSLGPALVSGNMSSLWIYLLAPPAGVIVAAFLHGLLRSCGCHPLGGRESNL